MQKVWIDQVRPGMLIGQDVYNELGQILLKRGTALTEGYVANLRARTYPAVWIMDGAGDTVDLPQMISPRLRAVTAGHLQRVFAAAEKIGSQANPTQPEHDRAEEFAIAARSRLAAVYDDAESLVNEVVKARILSGVTALKTHDSYTFDHSVEVAIAATLLGSRIGMQNIELHHLAVGCLLHDLGKVAVPQQVLNKPGKLTDDEYEIVKNHPEVGYLLAKKALGEGAIVARTIIRQHHERQDGKGYPHGLTGTNALGIRRRHSYGQPEILLAAEIAAVADVYSALSSDRPYHLGMPAEQVIAVMKGMAGTHLNRELVVRFLSMLPSYPVGSQVVVLSGTLRGSRGIVTKVNPRTIDRPVVKIMFDSDSRERYPYEIDTALEPGLAIASSSHCDLPITSTYHAASTGALLVSTRDQFPLSDYPMPLPVPTPSYQAPAYDALMP